MKKSSSTQKSIQRVLPLGNAWMVKSDDSKKFTVITVTQKEAIEIARSIAKTQHADLVVHNKNGKIKASYVY